MDFYENAVDVHEAAEILNKNGKHRMSVYNSCLAIELYLKSRLPLVENAASFEMSHDVVNIYRTLNKRSTSKKNLTRIVTLSRKYFNESRYPSSGTKMFTNELAAEFLEYVSEIKDYVDNQCIADINDLKNRYKK